MTSTVADSGRVTADAPHAHKRLSGGGRSWTAYQGGRCALCGRRSQACGPAYLVNPSNAFICRRDMPITQGFPRVSWEQVCAALHRP